MAVTGLPPELVTLILEEVYETQSGRPPMAAPGNPTLNACRLVCKSWAILAAEQLFRTIYFSFCSSVEDAREMAYGLYPPLPGRWIRDCHGFRWPVKSLSSFLDLFAGREGLRDHVRNVVLRGYAYDAWDVDKHEVPAQHLVDAITMLQHLRTLRLENVSISDDTLSNGHASHGVVARPLKHLTIHSEMRPNKQILRILRCFTTMEELQLVPYAFDFGDDHDVAAVQPPSFKLAIRSLDVARHEGEFLRHLLPLLDLNKLRHLSISCGMQPVTLTAVQHLIAVVGPTLEHLHYAYLVEAISHMNCGPDLSRCTSLKSAVLRIEALHTCHLAVYGGGYAMRAFARHIQNAHLETLGAHELILCVRQSSIPSLQEGSMESPLDEVLRGMCSRWDTLKQIRIMCEREEDEHARASITRKVRSLLPQPSAKDVLCVLFASRSMELPPFADLIITRL